MSMVRSCLLCNSKTCSYLNIHSLLLCSINLSSKVDVQYKMIRSILTTWFKLHTLSPSTEQEVQEQSLWHNSNINIGRESFCWWPWLSAGIVLINDILHPDLPRFLSHNELSEKYNIRVSFLQVLQIRSSIPYRWRQRLTCQAGLNIATSLKISDSENPYLDISKICSRKLYSTIILRKNQNVSSQRKWDLEFPQPQNTPAQEYWQFNFEVAFCSVCETKLQAFQFKLLHRTIHSNK